MVAAALMLGAALLCPVPDGEHCAAPPPPGSGLGADGRGMVHIGYAGFYTFVGATVNNAQPGQARWYSQDTYGSVRASASRIEWLRPDGRREIIPSTSLYPPIGAPTCFAPISTTRCISP